MNANVNCPVCNTLWGSRQAVIDHMLREHVYPAPRWPVQLACAGYEYGVVLHVLCNDGTMWTYGSSRDEWVQMPDVPQARPPVAGDRPPTESVRVAFMRQAIESACAIIETGDNRLLASDGPAGNQPPAISLGEWRQMYETLNKARGL